MANKSIIYDYSAYKMLCIPPLSIFAVSLFLVMFGFVDPRFLNIIHLFEGWKFERLYFYWIYIEDVRIEYLTRYVNVAILSIIWLFSASFYIMAIQLYFVLKKGPAGAGIVRKVFIIDRAARSTFFGLLSTLSMFQFWPPLDGDLRITSPLLANDIFIMPLCILIIVFSFAVLISHKEKR